MEDRGRELPLQEQAEAEPVRSRRDDRVPQGVPRLRAALARGAAAGIHSPRRRGRLGASLHDDELSGRSADRARTDEVRRQRHALSRIEAGDVERGGEDGAGRSGGGVRGLHERYGVGEVSGHARRTEIRCRRNCDGTGLQPRQLGRKRCHLDDHTVDASRQPRDLLLTQNRLQRLSHNRRIGRQLGEDRRYLDPCGQARRRCFQASARCCLRESRRGACIGS